jgi:hypothetical protein
MNELIYSFANILGFLYLSYVAAKLYTWAREYLKYSLAPEVDKVGELVIRSLAFLFIYQIVFHSANY